MASPIQSPSIRQLQLITPSESPSSPPSTSTSSSQVNNARLKQQRRQSSISYTSSGQNTYGTRSTDTGISARRSSIDYAQSTPISPPPATHKRRPRPLSIAIPNHDPSASSISTIPVQPRPQTLTEIYSPFLSLIAHKEAQVSELRSQLTAQENELAILKRKWEKIVRNHLAFPDREHNALTGLDGLDKIIRGIQNAALTATDAASEASSGHPSPVFSRLSLDSSAPSMSTDMNHTSPDSSVDIPPSSKPVVNGISPPRTTTTVTAATSTTRRRSLVPTEKRVSSSPSEASPAPVSSISSSSTSMKSKTSNSPRQRDNALAPLPGTALSSAAFSLIPQLTNMNMNIKNVNFSDLKGGMDKFISPQQQKRASKVFEGLWDAVASPSPAAAASARKEKKEKLGQYREPVNLLDTEDDEETLMPSRSSQFTVMAPDNSPKCFRKGELDMSITASPSGYLTSNRTLGLYTPPIKEEEKESEDSSEDWNW